MILSTPRLVLRRARPENVHDLHAAFSRPETMRCWATPEHETPDETANWLDRRISSTEADAFMVEYQSHSIGKAGAWRLPEVGLRLHPDHWSKGLAREAMTAVIDHLFVTHPLPHLTAEADARNDAPVGRLTRLGFVETHRAERRMQWRDSICLALSRENRAARTRQRSEDLDLSAARCHLGQENFKTGPRNART